MAELGVAYVDFALRRPALFRLMFGNECNTDDEERVRAAADVHESARGSHHRRLPRLRPARPLAGRLGGGARPRVPLPGPQGSPRPPSRRSRHRSARP
ncbi:TetR-like C-terminal domain-containing protein [Nocardioides convexus]|uniref:TetR-like C-terminal domain-containing protein n=1 Tax=Nocardioides convexus TaxID=2712224 RepID=UPI00310132C0